MRQPFAPFVDESQINGIDFFGVTLVAQGIQAALDDVVIGKLPEQVKVVQVRAGVLERQYQPVTAGIEQPQILEIRQDRPCAAVGKGIVDRLLFLLRAVNCHPRQRHLPRRNRPGDGLAGLFQLFDHAETFRLDKDRAAAFGDQRQVRPSGLGMQLVLVARRVFDRPAEHFLKQPIHELANDTGFAHLRAVFGSQSVIVWISASRLRRASASVCIIFHLNNDYEGYFNMPVACQL